MFIKDVLLESSDLEVELQTVASKYGFTPRILNTERLGNYLRLYMEDIEEEPLAYTYGENPEDIPEWLWDEIRRMVTILYEEEGIEYVDISPYNFIEKDDMIYMIDFGDAKYVNGEMNWFLREFLDGENSWNPDYK